MRAEKRRESNWYGYSMTKEIRLYENSWIYYCDAKSMAEMTNDKKQKKNFFKQNDASIESALQQIWRRDWERKKIKEEMRLISRHLYYDAKHWKELRRRSRTNNCACKYTYEKCVSSFLFVSFFLMKIRHTRTLNGISTRFSNFCRFSRVLFPTFGFGNFANYEKIF